MNNVTNLLLEKKQFVKRPLKNCLRQVAKYRILLKLACLARPGKY